MSERVPAGGPYRAAAGMHESLNLEHLSEARRLLYTYCPGEFCGEYLERLRKSSLIIARTRIEDLSRDANYVGIDKGILDLYRRMIELYSEYISGLLVTVGENIVVKTLMPVALDDRVVVEKGESLPLPPMKAFGLILAGLAEPIRETAIRLLVDDNAAGLDTGGSEE